MGFVVRTSNPYSAASFWFGFPASGNGKDPALLTERIQQSRTHPPLGRGRCAWDGDSARSLLCVLRKLPPLPSSAVSCPKRNQPRSYPVGQSDPVLSICPCLYTCKSTLSRGSLERCVRKMRLSGSCFFLPPATFHTPLSELQGFQNSHPKSCRGWS